MNGRAYQEEHKVRGLDGVLRDAADVQDAKGSNSTFAPQTPPEPSQAPPRAPKAEQPIGTRLRRLEADLRRLDAAWCAGYSTLFNAGAPLRSPTYDTHRTGKPGSRTPSEHDPRIRVALIVCAQRLATALRILARHDWLDADAWHPAPLQRTWVVMRDPWVEIPAYDESGEPLWRDPDITVEPIPIRLGVSQLRGVASTLTSVEWDKQDDADRETVRDMLHEAESAVGVVKARGLWDTPVSDPTPKVCVRQGCWNEVGDGNICNACKSKEYRERRKQRGAA